VRSSRVRLALALLAISMTIACIPYTYGRTAQTVPEGKRESAQTLWFMPNGITMRDSVSYPGTTGEKKGTTLIGYEYETRWGIDNESDFGLRAGSAYGITLSYKRRTMGYPDPDSAGFAWQGGLGIVNLGEHALGEFTLVGNSRARHGIQWYAGARAIGVTPISDGAVHDEPSLGGFLGLRLKLGEDELLPELAVYHDPSALKIRQADVVFVPSITFKGSRGFRLPGIFGRYFKPR
jgi:hypothetical protein